MHKQGSGLFICTKTMQTPTPARSSQSSYRPSPTLMRFCYALISTECRGKKTLAAARSGVPKVCFYREWKQSPEFRQWYAEQCDEYLKVSRPTVDLQLMKKIKQGSVAAMRTYYEVAQKIITGGPTHNIIHIENNVFIELQEKSDDELRHLAGRTRTHSLN